MLLLIFQSASGFVTRDIGYTNPGNAWWREALPRIPTTIPEDLQAYFRDMDNYLKKVSAHFNGLMFLQTPSDLTKDYVFVWNHTTERFEWSEVTL